MAAPAAAVISAIPAMTQAGLSIYQMSQANKLRDQDRPEYKVPREAELALAIARFRARQHLLPGQELMDQEIDQNVARAFDNFDRFAPSGITAAGLGAKYASGAAANRNQLAIKGAE